MESSPELVQEEQLYFVKGKRTKRYRLQSSIHIRVNPDNIVATDFSPKSDETSISSDIYGSKKGHNTTINDRSIMIMTKNTSDDIRQPASSSEIHNPHGDSTTKTVVNQDDEDLANCLILLAQGQSNRISQIPPPRIIGQKRSTYDSIYECKTCGKRFSSFQALGGHRASHKKPKKDQFHVEINPREHILHNSNNHFFLSDDEISPKINTYPTLSLQILNSDHRLHYNNKSKIHECSICGAEFSSGQALGGHMRRHRGVATVIPASSPAMTALSLIPLTAIPSSDFHHHDRYSSPDHDDRDLSSGLSLDLDLNLPAVIPRDENRGSRFQCASKQQQQQTQTQPLVFSSPALVGCHH